MQRRNTAWASSRSSSAAKDALSSISGAKSLDFLVPPAGLSDSAVVFPAVKQAVNAGRGPNTRGSGNIITDGSVVVVLEGYGLPTFQDGAVTAIIDELGAYRWDTGNQRSELVFSGDGIFSSTRRTLAYARLEARAPDAGGSIGRRAPGGGFSLAT